MQLSPNIFSDNKDFIGLTSEDYIEETKYATIEKVVHSEDLIT